MILAHAGHDHPTAPQSWADLWTGWPVEPFVWVPLALSAWLYARGVRLVWREAGRGHGITRWEAASFGGGQGVLFVALASPLHPWGNALFSVHMSQHELLMLVAAPLLVLGKPAVAFLKALSPKHAQRVLSWTRPRWVRGTWGVLTNPFAAWLLHAVVLWAWHIPALFTAALRSEYLHALQHASFLGSALLFWWAILHTRERVLGYGPAVLYLFTTALHSGLLGALIALAGRVWYPDYLGTAAAWGLTPLEDQELGGLIMWVPACTVYIAAGLVLFAGWLRASEVRVRRTEAVREVQSV